MKKRSQKSRDTVPLNRRSVEWEVRLFDSLRCMSQIQPFTPCPRPPSPFRQTPYVFWPHAHCKVLLPIPEVNLFFINSG
jgi:hypothetical protein